MKTTVGEDDKSTEEGRRDNPVTATARYEDSSVASKGLVSTLTNVVNSFFPARRAAEADQKALTAASRMPPTSPEQLMERIRGDYVDQNYLWTGDIDLSAFDEQCQFTDPTLSFTGTDTFVQNIQNLRPIVDLLVGDDDDDDCDDSSMLSLLT